MNFKYYNLKEILKRNAQYNIIIGERSNGKTYAVEKHILEKFFSDNEQGAIIRRWREDFRNKRGATMFSPFISDGTLKKLSHGNYNDIIYRSGVWYVAYIEENKVIDSKQFCYSFALSEVEHDKSTSYPNVTTILFDEFLTRSYYLNDEFVLFCNTLSTIIRERDNVTIFMCGNTVNKYSPYFSELGLNHIKEMKQGTIDLYTYGDSKLKVAVEYCANIKTNRKKSDVYFAFNNPHLSMIKEGKWEIANYPHLPFKYKPKDVLFMFWCVFGTDVIQGNIITSGNNIFCYLHRKTTNLQYKDTDIVYDLQSHSEYNRRYSFTHPIDNIDNKIYNLYKSNRFFYQSNDVGEIINNFVKE